MNRCRRCSSDVLPGARVPDHGFHLILCDELQLLELADPPLLVRGEEASITQCGQFFVVLLVVVVELPELMAFGGEALDHDIGLRHGNLPAAILERVRRCSEPAAYIPPALDCGPRASLPMRAAMGPPSIPILPASGLPW